MAKFLSEILTPNWWISVVIVGLLINIASSFIYKWYEEYSAKHSDRKRKELQDRERHRQEKILALKSMKDAYTFQYLKINHFRQTALEKYLLSVIFINIPFIISSMSPYFMTDIIAIPVNIFFASFTFTSVRLGLKMSRQAKFEDDILDEAGKQII